MVYAVARGRTTGVFDTWSACEKSVKGFSRALYKRLPGRAEAIAWVQEQVGAAPEVDAAQADCE